MRFTFLLLVATACRGEPLDAAWCSDDRAPLPDAPDGLTWNADIAPIVQQKCAACHAEGGHAPYVFASYDDVVAASDAILSAVGSRQMPPFLAEACCAAWFQDFDLTDDERARLLGWIEQGAPEGDPADAGDPLPPIGGVSRVDLTLTMDEPYTPDPPAGSVDDNRCFLLDWPFDREVRITGLAPRPGAREVVHHVIVASISGDDIAAAEADDAADDAPGWDCEGGLGEFPTVRALGGSQLGGDYPRGIGTPVAPNSRILLQMHYSVTDSDPPADQTSLDFRIDDTAIDTGGIVIANPAWLVDETFLIPAGETDAAFWYRFKPTLFTGGKPVNLQGAMPHMHRFGTRFRMLAEHPDGTSTCLLEIGDWDFGWTQPFWYAEPIRFDPDDELYLECHFDNSASNQLPGEAPRDIAWGEDNQDMCAGFLTFTRIEE
jgi:hypothetical protein